MSHHPIEVPSWPSRKLKQAYHVGTMNHADKRRGSQEGAGLSISKHPDAWRQIAPSFVSGDDWVVRPQKAAHFLDIHKLKQPHRAVIETWGIEKGLTEMAPIFELTYFDDEFEQDFTCLFTNEQDAIAESDECGGQVTPVQGLVASDALKAISLNDCEPVLVHDMLTIAYAELALHLTRCWWTDRLDIERLSAPRGVIFQSQIHRWSIERRP